MITDLIIQTFAAVVGTLLGGISGLVPEPPAFVVSGVKGLSAAFGNIGAFSYWLPVHHLAPAAAAAFGAMLMGFSIRAIRIVVSLLTGGGGAGA